MIIFGPAGKPLMYKNKDLLSIPEFLASHGLYAMEYEAVRGVKISRDKAVKFGTSAGTHGLTLSLHAPYYINLSSSNPITVKKSIERLLASIHAASLMKAWIVVFHPGYYDAKLGKKSSLKAVIRSLAWIRKEVESYGIHGVYLGIETMGRTSQLGSLEEVLAVSSEAPGVYPVIDWAHIYARTHGRIPRNTGDVVKIIDQIENTLGHRVIRRLHMHFSTMEYGTKGELRHHTLSEPFGPSFKIIIEALCSIGVGGTIISESPILEIDAIRMKNMYIDICGR